MKAFDFAIKREGAVSRLFRDRGIADFRSAAHFIRHLPYHRNSSRDNLSLVFTEGCGTCGSKHAVLKALAMEQGREEVRLMTGIYRMSEANTPGVGPVLKGAGIPYVPEAHNYLRIGEAILDVTFPQSAGGFADDLLTETSILPHQVGTWKVAFHQEFLAEWIKHHSEGTAAEIWSIREACIAALTRSGR